MTRRFTLRISSLLLVFVTGGCIGPAQIGPDREAFKSVDALYTAVSLRDSRLLEECAGKLSSLHAAGKLPVDASVTLNSIIGEAKGGGWERAQEQLANFMEGQRK